MPATQFAEVDAAIDRLHANKDAWLAVSIRDRIQLLERVVDGLAAVADRWAAIDARIKGLAPDDQRASEAWLAAIMPAIREARLLANALRAGGAPRARLRTSDDGHTIARVFPTTTMERLMYAGVSMDVWLEKGKPPTQGAIYRAGGKPDSGRVCLVLGAGNVSSIPVLDVLYKLFVADEVVLLKMSPVNEALGPVFGEALEALIDRGSLAIVYGGADVGGYAARHPKIGSLHATGSCRTFNSIVWGDPENTSGQRVNERPFTAELGCVTPLIVVPGPWSQRDLRFQARHVASMIGNNASFNCNAAKVIVTARGWPQREAFLDAVHAELAKLPARKAYYPNAREQYRMFLAHYPYAKTHGAISAQTDEVLPWTSVEITPGADSYALRNEVFCCAFAEIALDADGRDDPRTFLERAVAFANERCMGTLSCTVLVHPATEKRYRAHVEKAIADLRYGDIGVNVWSAVIFALVSSPWGAYPGHPPEDIQSGTGVVHNPFLFDYPEKTVMRAPFRSWPTPAWFIDRANLLELGRRTVAFEARPTWRHLLGVVRAALG